jgi:hypothetical protein
MVNKTTKIHLSISIQKSRKMKQLPSISIILQGNTGEATGKSATGLATSQE